MNKTADTESAPHPKSQHPEIKIWEDRGSLVWQYCDGATFSDPLFIPLLSHLRGPDEILSELIRTTQPIFYLLLPHKDLRIQCPPELFTRPDYGYQLQGFVNLVGETNRYLLSILELKNIAKSFRKILFYEFDHFEFKQLYELARELAPEDTLYLKGDLGFNKMSRRWEQDREDILSMDQLVARIQQDKISKIVTVNMYYPQLILRGGIHLPTVLKFLGLECILIDFDLYDSSYLFKAAFHCNDFRRYSVYEHHQSYWDQYFGLKNNHYIPTGYIPPSPQPLKPLKADYEIAIASHARASDLLITLEPLLYIFQQFKSDDLVTEFQHWYYSFKYWAMNYKTSHTLDKAYLCKALYILYLNGISLLKYETISQIKTDRPIRIYGDEEWAKLFPALYQKQYLDDYAKFFSEGRHLNLLLNSNFSYLENNPVFARTLRLGAPYLCFPALVCSESFEGMRHLEYRKPVELNQKLENINQLIEEPSFIRSKNILETILHEGFESTAREILGLKSGTEDDSLHYRKRNKAEIHLAVAAYEKSIASDSVFFESLFENLFKTGAFGNIIEKTRFRDRDYFQRLISMKSK